MGKSLVRWLRTARGSPASVMRADLLENGSLVRLGDKVNAARALLSGCTDQGQEDLLDAKLGLEDLPTELRAVVAASGHSFEDVLWEAQDIGDAALMDQIEAQSTEDSDA